MRLQIAALSLSAAAFVGIAVHESYREKAYLPTPDDVPTIGFGTTDGVKMGDRITVERALVRLLSDADKFQIELKRCIGDVPMHQYEWDAFVSWAYNVGTGAACRSTLVKKLKERDYVGACAELSKWVYQAGKKLNGLVNRREQERAMCEGRS